MVDFTRMLADPNFRLGLHMLSAAGPQPGNPSFGQRLGGAVGMQDQWVQQALQKKLREKQMEALEKRLDWDERKMKAQERKEKLMEKVMDRLQPQELMGQPTTASLTPDMARLALLSGDIGSAFQMLQPAPQREFGTYQGQPYTTYGDKFNWGAREPMENPYGGGTVGRAYNILAGKYNIPPETMAEHIVTTPRIVVGPGGERYEYTPGLPPGVPTPQPTTTPREAAPQAPVEEAPRGTIQQIVPGERKKQLDTALTTIDRVIDRLNEAKKKGIEITGIEGALKSEYGGYARQAGMPVGTESEDLQRDLLTLQGIVGPLILNEKRLSETERERLRAIVGDLSKGKRDDPSIRSGMGALLDFLESLEK